MLQGHIRELTSRLRYPEGDQIGKVRPHVYKYLAEFSMITVDSQREPSGRVSPPILSAIIPSGERYLGALNFE